MPERRSKSEREMTKPISLEEKLADAMEMIESGHDSTKDWEFLKAINNKLHAKKKCGKCSKRELKILKLIAPTINKHANKDGDKITLDPSLAHL